MKIVVIGGTGLVGAKLARSLRRRGHEVLAASPSTGVDLGTGKGLAAALDGAAVVVDVSNPDAFDVAAQARFESVGRRLLAAEQEARVAHHVALSVVGTDRLPTSAYFRAKLAQEYVIRAASVPFTIVRATELFEFARTVVAASTVNGSVLVPSASVQPIASADVVAVLADTALDAASDATFEIAGPEPMRLADWLERTLAATADSRIVAVDANARYFGAELRERSLVPAAPARLGATRLERWLAPPLVRI